MSVKDFLMKTECHFNWDLPSVMKETSHEYYIQRFKGKLDGLDIQDHVREDVRLRLRLQSAFHELFNGNHNILHTVDEVIDELEQTQYELVSKYRESYLHVAYSFKAFTLLETKNEATVNMGNLLKKIKPFADMTAFERSAVLLIHNIVLRSYGPKGLLRGIPLIREAIRLNPEEIEGKMELIVSLHRKRHYDRNHYSLEDSKCIQEPINILEQLLDNPKLNDGDRISCMYFLAVAYSDYSRCLNYKHNKKQIDEYRHKTLSLCNCLADNHGWRPGIMGFCAKKLMFSSRAKARRIILLGLEKFPKNVQLNTTACTIYKQLGDLKSALRYAETAMEGGGYGASCLYLELKTKLGEEFDDVQFFANLLSLREGEKFLLHNGIHLEASMYYLLTKHQIVKGAAHLEKILLDDPSYKGLQEFYYSMTQQKVFPLELAYIKIKDALMTDKYDDDDKKILDRVKFGIEELVDLDCDLADQRRGIIYDTRKDFTRGGTNNQGANKYGSRNNNSRSQRKSLPWGNDRSKNTTSPTATTSSSNSNWRQINSATKTEARSAQRTESSSCTMSSPATSSSSNSNMRQINSPNKTKTEDGSD